MYMCVYIYIFNVMLQYLVYFRLIFMICFVLFCIELSWFQINVLSFVLTLDLKSIYFCCCFFWSSKLLLDSPKQLGQIKLIPKQFNFFYILKNMLATSTLFVLKENYLTRRVAWVNNLFFLYAKIIGVQYQIIISI